MQYSFNKLEATKSKDAAILKAYTTVSSCGLYADKRNRGEEGGVELILAWHKGG